MSKKRFRQHAQNLVDAIQFGEEILYSQLKRALVKNRHSPKVLKQHFEPMVIEYQSALSRSFVNRTMDIKKICESGGYSLASSLDNIPRDNKYGDEMLNRLVDGLLSKNGEQDIEQIKKTLFEQICNTMLAIYDKHAYSGNIEFENTKCLTLSRKVLHSDRVKKDLKKLLSI